MLMKEWKQCALDLGARPLFTENICWILWSCNVVKINALWRMHSDAIASQTWWKDNALWCLCDLACTRDAEFTTDSLSPNMWLFLFTWTPKHQSMLQRSVICSTQVLATTNSEEQVAVSTMACFLEHQAISQSANMQWWICLQGNHAWGLHPHNALTEQAFQEGQDHPQANLLGHLWKQKASLVPLSWGC